MILGITLEQATKLVGKSGLTRSKDISKALRAAGRSVPRRLVRVRNGSPLPARCLLKAVWLEGTGRRSHWLLRWDGTLYDSLGYSQAWHEQAAGTFYKVSSYLPLD